VSDPQTYRGTAQRIEVPGGWIYYGGPLSGPVLVSDPSQWAQSPAAVAGQLERVLASLSNLHLEFHRMSQSSQEHADALAATLNTMDATLKSGLAAITAEIATLKASNPAVDFTGIDTAVANLGTDVAAAAAVAPAA
jgi:hypothetical protein